MPFDISYHDDGTMTNVMAALNEAGLTEGQATEAVRCMQNAGILFRERPSGTVKFGGTEEVVHVDESLKPPEPFTEEAMHQFWERDRVREEDLERIRNDYYKPLANNPDRNPFKKLKDEREALQDDSSLD